MLTYNNNYVPLAQLKTINMPRQARKTSGTGIYHVMLRGINRQDMMRSRSRIQTTGPNNGHQLRDYSCRPGDGSLICTEITEWHR